MRILTGRLRIAPAAATGRSVARGTLRSGWCGLLAAGLLASSPGAQADTALTEAIAPQPVVKALTAFAHQTGLQLVFVSAVAGEQWSKGARAGLSVTDALRELLDGTGLTFTYLNPRALRIAPLPAPPPSVGPAPTSSAARPASTSGTALHMIEVIGRADKIQSDAIAYVQDVPASVEMISGPALVAQNAGQLVDYSAGVAGMNILSPGAPGQSQVIIRGIAPLTDAAGVAFYLDDTPIGSSGLWANAGYLSLDLPPYDLERLEVWRGPTGTSDGADSGIGLIRYALRQPALDHLEAGVQADVSVIHGAKKRGGLLSAVLNIPIVADRLAIRTSVYDSYAPGYIDTLAPGKKSVNTLRRYGARIAATWRPAPPIWVTLNALSYRIVAASVSKVVYDGAARIPDTGDAYFVTGTAPYGGLITHSTLPEPEHKGLNLYSLSVRWLSDAVQASSVTSWSRSYGDLGSDATVGNGQYYSTWSGGLVRPGLAFYKRASTLRKFSEELHINSPEGRRFEWLLAGFYTRESANDEQSTIALDQSGLSIPYFAPALIFQSTPTTFTERVVFANTALHLTTRWEVGGGIRVAHDDQDFTVTYGAWNVPTGYDSGTMSETATSWSAFAKYALTTSAMLYGRAATGFQPGAPLGSQPGYPTNVRGETLTSYELGLKAEYLERRALIDVTLFYVDWRDIHVGVTENDLSFLANGAQQISRGMEFKSSCALLPHVLLTYNSAYTISKLIRVVPGAPYLLTGYQIPDVPKWNMSLMAQYEHTILGSWHARVGASWRWVGETWNVPLAVQSYSRGGYPAVLLPAYSVIDLDAQVSRGPLTLRIFARNLADRRADLNAFAVLDGESMPAQVDHILLQPRTLGIGIAYDF